MTKEVLLNEFTGLEKDLRAAIASTFIREFKIKKQQSSFELTAYNSACRVTIILNDCEMVCGSMEEAYYLTNDFMVADGAFSLVGTYYKDFTKIDDEEFKITFRSAESKVEPFRARISTIICDSPFEYLYEIADTLIEKQKLGEKYLNKKEMELLPIANEIFALWGEEGYQISFPFLSHLADNCGCERISKALKSYEKRGRIPSNDAISPLFTEIKAEKLWRDIFEAFNASQESYPNVNEVCNHTEFEDAKETIKRVMTENSYSGAYPDFYKKGKIDGIKYAASNYGRSRYIGFGREAEFFIHCNDEISDDGSFDIEFVCGTALFKKENELKDAYSCLFGALRDRFINEVYYHSSEKNEKPLEIITSIAAKKTEYLKLTKEEKHADESDFGSLLSFCVRMFKYLFSK